MGERDRRHPCQRCGIAVYNNALVCRDCRTADPVYLRMTSDARRTTIVIDKSIKENKA